LASILEVEVQTSHSCWGIILKLAPARKETMDIDCNFGEPLINHECDS
jgi:hypothetical protein